MRFGSVVWMLGIRYAIAGEMVADAESLDETLVGQPILAEGTNLTDLAATDVAGDEELAAPELDSMLDGRRPRRKHRFLRFLQGNGA